LKPRKETAALPSVGLRSSDSVSVPTTPIIQPRLLTIKQAAAYCSAAIWAIRQAIINKELRACIIGRRFLIDRAALDAFIDRKISERAA
jgi:excisionase family DNA binding protein